MSSLQSLKHTAGIQITLSGLSPRFTLDTMVLDECSPITVFLQSEHEARRFRDKVKFDFFKPAFIKTPIEEIHVLGSEEDGNAGPRSVAGYVKRREGSRRAIDPPPQSNAKSEKQLDRKPDKEAEGLESGSGSGNGGEDGEGGSGDRGRDGKKEDQQQNEEKREQTYEGDYEDQFVWPEDEQVRMSMTLTRRGCLQCWMWDSEI